MFKHDKVEKNIGLMGVLIAVVISFGGIAEIVPLMFDAQIVEPLPGMKPYPPLELAGRDVYVSEGCYNCHSQMIRTLQSETARYGHYSVAGESVYDHPHQWGSKRTGPDLARVGGRYSDEWHRVHMNDPRAVVPESNMPGYPWLADRFFDAEDVKNRMRALRTLGHPYSDEDIDSATDALRGKSEMDALIAYLQGLGKYTPKSEPAAETTAAAADGEPLAAKVDASSTAGGD